MKLRVKTIGLNNIPANTVLVFLCQTIPVQLIFLVMVIGVPYHFNFIAKKNCLEFRLLDWTCYLVETFSLIEATQEKQKSALKKLGRLQKGWNMLIFLREHDLQMVNCSI